MEKKQQFGVLATLGLMSLLTSLAGASTNLALPKISVDLAISSSTATWIVSIGLITTAVFLVLFGHLGDLISKNTVFLFGGVTFVVGSLLTGLSPNFVLIIAARIIQAIGSAMIMANSMGIVRQYFPDNNRAEALAIISMFVSVGSLSGPAFGGILITWASWRWIYLFNVPVGLIVLLFGFRALPLPKHQPGEVRKALTDANWTGQNIFTAGVALFFLSGVWLQQPGQQLLGGVLLVIGLALTIYSFVQDQHAKTPWIASALMHNRDYLLSVSVLLIIMLVNAVSNILLPFYLQSYGGISAFNSGLIMMLQSVTMLVITPIAGYLADHWDRYGMTLLGMGVVLISQVGYLIYPAKISLVAVIWPIVVNGIGMALFLSPNNALTMGVIDESVAGVAGSLNSLARTFGMTVGISFGATLLFAQMPGITRIGPNDGTVFMPALRNAFWLAIAFSAVGTVMVALRYYSVLKAKKVAPQAH